MIIDGIAGLGDTDFFEAKPPDDHFRDWRFDRRQERPLYGLTGKRVGDGITELF